MRYDRQRLLDKILTAGVQFDGHVTNGSASALADLFEEELARATIIAEPKCPQCGDKHLRCKNGCVWGVS